MEDRLETRGSTACGQEGPLVSPCLVSKAMSESSATLCRRSLVQNVRRIREVKMVVSQYWVTCGHLWTTAIHH